MWKEIEDGNMKGKERGRARRGLKEEKMGGKQEGERKKYTNIEE